MKACRGAKRYSGLYKPTCNGGRPCDACLRKFHRMCRRIVIEVLRCQGCGAAAISIDDYRVTNHKCAGAWSVAASLPTTLGDVLKSIKRLPRGTE